MNVRGHLDTCNELGVTGWVFCPADPGERSGIACGVDGRFIAHGNSFRDSLRLVEMVDSPGMVLHLDAGCTWLNGDDIGEAIVTCGVNIRSFHVSQPQLLRFDAPAPYHLKAAKSLKDLGYDHWVCIEMLEGEAGFSDIEKAVAFTRQVYFQV